MRFEELTEGAAPKQLEHPFANAAGRTYVRGCALFTGHDWRGVAELIAADFRDDDHTALARAESGRDEWLASFRQIIEANAGPLAPELLATRGERLALTRLRWTGARDDIGPSEIDWLVICEVNARGQIAALVSFNPDDLGAAHAEIDARFAAGEGT